LNEEQGGLADSADEQRESKYRKPFNVFGQPGGVVGKSLFDSDFFAALGSSLSASSLVFWPGSTFTVRGD
jgi:hypothetical protein